MTEVRWEHNINHGDPSLKPNKQGYIRTPDGGSAFSGVESDGGTGTESHGNGGLLTVIGILLFVIGILALAGMGS